MRSVYVEVVEEEVVEGYVGAWRIEEGRGEECGGGGRMCWSLEN